MSARRYPAPAFRLKPIATAIMTSSVLAGAAHAAEPMQALPTVTVSAEAEAGYKVETLSSPKATAPLLDTPQTITVIPAEVFQQQGAKNLGDVLKSTPGISFNSGENGFASSTSSNFSLRGFDSSANIFIDGARDSGSYTRDVFNVEAVEVAKGPAADNGRGGAAGYVNMVTKTPVLRDANSGTASYGLDETDAEARLRSTLDLNMVLADSTALRVNLMLEDSGTPGREYVTQQNWGVAPSLAFGLGQPTRLILGYERVEQKGTPDFGIPAHSIPGTFRYEPSLRKAGRDNYYGLSSDFDETVADAALARIEHDLATGLTLSNQTRWAQTQRYALFTVPLSVTGQSVTTQHIGYGRENESLTNQTNLSASFQTGRIGHTVATGLEISREQADANRYPNNGAIGNPGSTDIFNPDRNRPLTGFVGFKPSQTSHVDLDTIAVYAYDTLQFNPQWQLTGGLRAERYEVEIDSRDANSNASLLSEPYRVKDTSLTGKLGLVFKPASNGSIYAAAGVSDLPPGNFLSNADISREGGNGLPGLSGLNNAEAKTQRSVGYELGTKWDFFDNRLSTTAALFSTTRRNVAMTGRDVTAGESATTLKGYGKQLVEGIELSAAGQITPAWSVFAGLVMLDSERQHSAELDRLRCEANPGDYGAASAAACAGRRTSGDELAFTPKTSASLWTTYQLPYELTVGGGVQYVGEAWVGRPDDAERIIDQGLMGKLPDYTVFNLMASYPVNPSLSLRLNIDNVTNERYARNMNWPAQRVELGAPRSYLLTADFKF